MVFLVKGTLTEEDRAAWRRLSARIKRREVRWRRCDWILWGIIWGLWLALKLLGLSFVIYGLTVLHHAVNGDMPLWLKVMGASCAVALAGCGIRLLILFHHSPDWPPPTGEIRVPAEELSDAQVQAAFFGDGRFTFWDASGKIRQGYSSVTGALEDEGRFYLFFADRVPLVLPKRGFVRRMPEDFRDFLERELGYPIRRVK